MGFHCMWPPPAGSSLELTAKPCKADPMPAQEVSRTDCQVHSMAFIPEGASKLALTHKNLFFNSVLEN